MEGSGGVGGGGGGGAHYALTSWKYIATYPKIYLKFFGPPYLTNDIMAPTNHEIQ